MKYSAIVIVALLILLTGCWSSMEIDQTVLVHGAGIDKAEEKIRFSVELVKPGSQDIPEGEGQGSSKHIILEKDADTMLDAARDLITDAKRRLDFGHTDVWIIGEQLAKEDFIHTLDAIRRDQMLRLNSYLFVSHDSPADILRTPTLYEGLTSIELVTALDQTQFSGEYAPIKLRKFFKIVEGPIPNAYIPIISIQKENEQEITTIGGTAVIRDHKMVGQLDLNETAGLNWLLNQVKGGSISVAVDNNEKISLEISSAKTTIEPYLRGHELEADVHIQVEGTLADNMTTKKVNKSFFKRIEKQVSQYIEETIRTTLNKLQQDLKADITDIGPETHRKYPKRWQTIQANWNDVFAAADISISVDTNFTHPGLINESVKPYRKKPYNNPYRFLK